MMEVWGWGRSVINGNICRSDMGLQGEEMSRCGRAPCVTALLLGLFYT